MISLTNCHLSSAGIAKDPTAFPTAPVEPAPKSRKEPNRALLITNLVRPFTILQLKVGSLYNNTEIINHYRYTFTTQKVHPLFRLSQHIMIGQLTECCLRLCYHTVAR